MNLECGYEALFWIIVLLNGVQQWVISKRKKLNDESIDLMKEMSAVIDTQQKILNDAGIQLIITKIKECKNGR